MLLLLLIASAIVLLGVAVGTSASTFFVSFIFLSLRLLYLRLLVPNHMMLTLYKYSVLQYCVTNSPVNYCS